MTWVGDENIKVRGSEQDKLLADREKLVEAVKALSVKPLPNKTNSAIIGRKEDLLDLAKKIKQIDKKLGRITD